MLVLIEQLPHDTIEQEAVILGYLLKNIVAIDLEIQAELHVSHARRKLGRPSRYFVMAPDGGTYIHYFRREATPENPRGANSHKSYGRVMSVTAFSDSEAVEKANKLMPKKYERFMRECYREYVREEGKDFGTAWWQEEKESEK